MRNIRFNYMLLLIPVVLMNNAARCELPMRGICAHRGASFTHPENTIAAFQEAIRLGSQMIELDVQMSKDSALVLMHDKTVDRTTNGSGRVSDLTLDDLKKLDAGSWKDSVFINERIPTLDEALRIMPKNIWLNIHIKDDPRVGVAAARLILHHDRLAQAFVACKKEAARAALAIDDRIKICNMDRRDDATAYVDETIEFKAGFIQLKNDHLEKIPSEIPKLKSNQIRINYYGIKSVDELGGLFDMGVDFILVEDIAAAFRAAKDFGIEPVKPEF